MREAISIPWGPDRRLALAIPDAWRLTVRGRARAPAPIDDLAGAVHAGLGAPIGLPPLARLVTPDTRIALVMDDASRPTPISRLAPVVVDHLLKAGARPENVTGLFAIGTHRRMSADAMAARVGPEVARRIRCLDFDCRDARAFADLGTTQRGTRVRIHRLAVEADLRICLGTIEAHPQAGFGGGYKALLPGLAHASSVAHNHLLLPGPDAYNMIGTAPEANPMRLDLEEAGRMVSGPTLVLNCVLDGALQPVAVLAGDAVAAHRAGVEIARRTYGVPLERPVDVALASAHPLDDQLRQAGKCVVNVAGACKAGGLVIGFMRCEGGSGETALPSFPFPIGGARAVMRLLGGRAIARIARHLPGRIAPEARFMLNFGMQMLKDYDVLIYSPALARLNPQHRGRILFDDQSKLFAEAERRLGRRDPELAVFDHGGVSFPVFDAPVSA